VAALRSDSALAAALRSASALAAAS
jgi:hypothetical protein